MSMRQSMKTTCQNGTQRQKRTNKWRLDDHWVHLDSRRYVWRSPFILVCWAVKKMIKSAMKNSSRCVAKFWEVSTVSPNYQKTRRYCRLTQDRMKLPKGGSPIPTNCADSSFTTEHFENYKYLKLFFSKGWNNNF